MAVEIESFTTEVTLLDPESPLTPQQMERIVQEVLRRLERQLREERRSEQAAAFGRPAAAGAGRG